MIKFENRFDEYAYRNATREVAAGVEVEEGKLITIKAGKVVLAGPTDIKAFMAIGSNRTGRDQVSGRATKRISYIHGAWELSTTCFKKTATYSADMTALTAENGEVRPAVDGEVVHAYAIGKPANSELRIISA